MVYRIRASSKRPTIPIIDGRSYDSQPYIPRYGVSSMTVPEKLGLEVV